MALGLTRTVQNLKGRDNYLCKYHLQRILSEQNAYQLPHYAELIRIYEQLPGLSLGEKNEILHIPQDSPLWYGITAHAEVCLASKCPMQSECFLYQVLRLCYLCSSKKKFLWRSGKLFYCRFKSLWRTCLSIPD